jgi:Hint domain
MPGISNESVTLTAPGQSFEGGDGSGNTITVDAALLSEVTIDGGSGGGNTLILTGSDTTVTPSSSNLADLQSLLLEGSGLTVDAPTASLDGIYIYDPGDTVTLDSNAPNAIDYSGGNAVIFTGSDQTLYADESPGTTSGVQDTLVGFNSTDTSDSILLQELASVSGPIAVNFDGTNTSVTISGADSGDNAQQYTFEFKGNYTSGDFTLTPQGGGYVLTYDSTAPATTAILTTGTDDVGSGVTQVIATDGTLTSGDLINPSSGANLDLVGGGTFDLTQPSSITNIGSITVDSADANVTLLSGLVAPVTLSAGGDDTVTLANDNDNINANGGANDVFNASVSQAENATITGGPFSTLNIDALTDGGGQAITLSSNITDIQYVSLDGGANSFDPGANGPALLYLEDIDGTGNNTIELTGNTNAAIDYTSSGSQSDNFFFDPASSSPQVVTIAYENAPTENLYGFDSNSQVLLSAFDYGNSTPSLAVTTNITPTGGPGVLLTVTGTDSGGTSITQSLQLYGNYTAADFSLSQNSGGSGASLTYSGTTTTDTLSSSTSQSISGVSDVYAAANQFGEGGSIETNAGGTLHLVGPGSFELNNTDITGVTTIDGESGNQSITLGSPTGEVTVNLAAEGHDVLYNLTPQTTIEGGSSGNNYGTTVPGDVNDLTVNMGSGGNNQIAIDNDPTQSYSLTLDAPGITGVNSFAIDGDNDISINTGDYQATTGIPINIDIADDEGSSLGGDSVTLDGNGDSVSDFFGGNFFTLEGPNEVVTDLRNGSSLSNVETISGFDQGASTNDTISVPFPDTVGPSTGTGTESVAVSEDPSGDSGIGTTTLTLTGTEFGASYTSQIVLDGLYGGTFVATKVPDLSNGWDITYTACYQRGTHILSEQGEVAIETLQIGDRVRTLGGALRPVRWLGHRRLNCQNYSDPRGVWPICIRASAFAEHVPARDLLVSPGHSICINGSLIQAANLVNGVTVLQQPQEYVEYWHVELDSHDILFAEGLPSESYLDTGNRSAFVNGGEFLQAHPDFGPKPWTDTCLPLVMEGAALVEAKQALLDRAKALGFCVTHDADLHVVADGTRIDAISLGASRFAFVLPAGCGEIDLRMHTFIPGHTRAASRDTRELGVCVGRLQLDSEDVSLEDEVFFAAQWHRLEQDPSGRHWRWTQGRVSLPAGTRLVVIKTIGLGYYWESPHADRVQQAPAVLKLVAKG